MKLRRLIPLAMAGTLLLGACGGDDGTVSQAATTTQDEGGSSSNGGSEGGNKAIEDAESCQELIEAATPVFTDLFQQLVDDTQDLSVEDLAKLGEDVEGSEIFQNWTDDVQADSQAIDDKANELGCSEDDAQQALCQAVDGVTADNEIAKAMIEGMATSGGCA